ncbi:DUF202 domain-containing protein [Rhodococcus sp. 27YEA6]|uniref:DUF202 domain-containing protein n=1 Tax=Rhodococcus sp. 27YEA6 TaxID=3156273 RepID=UPI003834A46A
MTKNEPPGLQPERTVLAWRRTALSSVTVSVIIGREIALHPSVLRIAVFATLIITTAGVIVGTTIRHRRLTLDDKDSREIPFIVMATLAVGVTVAGLGTCTVIQL